jgi:hypothetical protein
MHHETRYALRDGGVFTALDRAIVAGDRERARALVRRC